MKSLYPYIRYAVLSTLMGFGIVGCGGVPNTDSPFGGNHENSSSSSSGGGASGPSVGTSSSGTAWTPSSSSSTSSSSTSTTSTSTTSTSTTSTSSSTSSTSTSSTSTSGLAGSTTSSSSGRFVVSSSSSGWLNCEQTSYKYDPLDEPHLAPTLDNASAAGVVGDQAWLEQQGWIAGTLPRISSSSSSSSTSSSGGLIVIDRDQSSRLMDKTPLTGYQILLAGGEAAHAYEVSMEAKAANSGEFIDFYGNVSISTSFFLPNGTEDQKSFYRSVFNVEQLNSDWTPVAGIVPFPTASTYLTLGSIYGPVIYRNIKVNHLGLANPQPDDSELTAAINKLRVEWNEVSRSYSIAQISSNYAWLQKSLIHGGSASCDAGSVNGLQFPLFLHSSVPRYRLKLILDAVGESEGSIAVNLYGTINPGVSTLSGMATSPLVFQKQLYEKVVLPGEAIEIDAMFDYYPFSTLNGHIISNSGALEFLVKSISLDRVYSSPIEE